MSFGEPGWLFLLLLVPGLILAARKSRSGLERGRAVFATALRVVLFAGAVFALADARHVSKSYRTATMFLLDHSFSVPFEVKRDATAWVNEQLLKVPKDDVAGVILFGREAMIELPPRPRHDKVGLSSVVGRAATDLGAAIRLALAVFPEGYQRRIVVVSDGNENLGDARAEAEAARAHGATIDVFPLRYDYPSEAWIEGLHVPPEILPKEPFDVTVVVSSQREGPANLALYRDQELLSVRKVTLTRGKNVFSLRQRVERGGSFSYRALIEAPGDAVTENNEAHAIASARGEARIALIPGEAADGEALLAALRSEGLPAILLPSDDLARRAAEFAGYDALIFANVEATRLGPGVMRAVEAAVHDAGVGLIFVGGERSFGPGGYRGSPMEELLPVTMEQPQRRVMPNGALALVLHTCEFDAGNHWAKKIAVAAMETLNAKDYFGVLIYGAQGEEWLFKPTLVSDKARLAGLINGAWPGDMPSFDATLQLAHQGLKDLPAASKHVVVISDADPSGPTAKLVDDMVASKISISTVAIQPHGASDLEKMAAVAARAGGRFYHVRDASTLPQIFIKEAATVQRSMVIEGAIRPVVTGSVDALKGIAPDEIPPLHGYTLVNPKPLARVSMGMPISKEGQPADAPGADVLLAEWQYGLGRTMVFTSDAKNRWAKSWIGWEKYRKFWSQAARSVLRSTRRGPYAVQAEIEGGKGRVLVDAVGEDGKLLHTLRFKGSATSPEGGKQELSFRQTAPGRYEAEFEAGETGVYAVQGSFEGPHGEKGVISQGVPLSYAAEYRDLQANLPLLDTLRERGGGRRLSTATNVYESLPTAAGVSKPLWPLLLTLVLALLPLDVFTRRVAVDWGALLARWRKPKAADVAPPEIPEHLRALAARKMEVRAEKDVEAIDLGALSKPSATSSADAPASAPEAKPEPQAEAGYLDKLLEAKKKAKKKE